MVVNVTEVLNEAAVKIKASAAATDEALASSSRECKDVPSELKLHKYGWMGDPSSMLHNPHFNKGTAYTYIERKKMNLLGLLPRVVEDIDKQARRCYQQCLKFTTPMSKYLYLASLRERNETLFYYLVTSHLEEMMPYIYTPTVGQACLEYGLQFRQAEGMYICQQDRGRVLQVLENWKPAVNSEMAIAVITDGSRILGLGDLGTCGMGIPIGKLSLYVAAGGFHPATTLPIVLDTGTNNESLLEDEFYLGERHKRLPDSEFYPLVDEVLMAIKHKWPGILVQFEDFSNDHCFNLLQMYRDKILCFNDDIQGTGVVIASGLLNALKVAEFDDPRSLRILFFGAGSAGVGVADQIRQVLELRYGLSEDESLKSLYLVDSQGLVTKTRTNLADHKLKYVRHDIGRNIESTLEILDVIKPHGIIGLSGETGSFTPEIIKKMSELNERPIIFSLSNPNSKAECTFEDAVKYSKGKAIWASGSPFDPVTYEGTTYHGNQGNNLYAFPGIGFGAWISSSKHVSQTMLNVATIALADNVTDEELSNSRLYPLLDNVREVSQRIALCVARQSIADGTGYVLNVDTNDEFELRDYIKNSMYVPEYVSYVQPGER